MLVRILLTHFQFFGKSPSVALSFGITKKEQPLLCLRERPRNEEEIEGYIQYPSQGKGAVLRFKYKEKENKKVFELITDDSKTTSFFTTNSFVEDKTLKW